MQHACIPRCFLRLRSLNQTQVFTDAEKRRESAVLLAYQRDLLFSLALSSLWSTPAIAIAPNPRIKVTLLPTTPLDLMSEFPCAQPVLYDPIVCY